MIGSFDLSASRSVLGTLQPESVGASGFRSTARCHYHRPVETQRDIDISNTSKFCRRTPRVRSISFGAFFLSTVLAAQAEAPLQIGDRKQLFVDDLVIARLERCQQVLNPAVKHPFNPMMTPQQRWEGDEIRIYGSVLYDRADGVFKMWYSRFLWKGPAAGCYATSRDGYRWDRPSLNLVDFQGSKDNNNFGKFVLGVVFSPDERDPARRYKALAGRKAMFSPDGLHWTVPPGARDIPGDVAGDNVIPISYDERRHRYLAFPKVVREAAGHRRRAIAVSTSADFFEWTPAETILVPDEKDDELARARIEKLRDRLTYVDSPEWHLAQFYGMCGFPYQDLYLGLLWVFDISGWPAELEPKPAAGGEDGSTQVELVASRDLRHWQRVGGRQLFIPAGSKGSWDAGLIHTASRPVIVGDEIWIYYSGADRGHRKTMPPYRSGIGIAKIRLDGWVSLNAGSEEGTATTKPLTFDGSKLVINASAKGGSITAELLDGAGRVLKGYGREDCTPFSGDSIRYTVLWRGGSLKNLAGRPVILRFLLKDACLYAFQFQRERP